MHGAARGWRILFAIVGWLGLIAQYALSLEAGTRSVFGSTVIFFSYFTVLTNVLVVLALTAPALFPDSRLGRWTASEGVRAAVAMYIAVVGLIYHTLLDATWNPQGLLFYVNQVLHTVMPIAFVLDWLLFVPKGLLRWIDPGKWLAWPLLYGVWTVIHGQLIDWYPYWFIDIDELGWGRTAMNFAALLAVFLVLGLIVVALDRGLAAFGKGDSSLIPS
ncbi:Pr6Pr family membrane protein [Brevundimonas sp.]|uniref:Pr6Pr family membrane protein n=1 Tax=Brevundimonas sp. TaxID=1871086 RepID=UPI00286C060F|nr:Pr6Pr family membrane protein [Brevundimonas sp.]